MKKTYKLNQVFGIMKRIASWRYIRGHFRIKSTNWNGPDTNVVKSVMLGDCGVGKVSFPPDLLSLCINILQTCMLTRIATPSFFQSGFCDSSSNTPCFTVGLGFNTLLVSGYGRDIKLKVFLQIRFTELNS